MNPTPETKLALAMRDEAMNNTPQFSPLLHQRIMQQVHDAHRQPGSAQRSLRLPLWLSVAAAAALALAVGLIALLHGPDTSSQDLQADVAMLPTPQKFVAQQVIPVHDRLVASIDEGKLAYLDQDARELADFVKGRLSLVMVTK